MSRLSLSGILMALFLVSAFACTPEEYGPCTLPRSEALDEACSTGEGGDGETVAAASCVVDFVFECESKLCGTYNGEDAFCTVRCDPESDPCPAEGCRGVGPCPEGGYCEEWVPGLNEWYCVPKDLFEKHR